MANLLHEAVGMLMSEAREIGEHSLKRALGASQPRTLGIGAIIGAGIFVMTGQAAAHFAGPGHYDFICRFRAWRARLPGFVTRSSPSMIPIAGSAYTYSYATLGEFFAWIIGWDLILEYAMGAGTVSLGW